jgi:hypothetical protein
MDSHARFWRAATASQPTMIASWDESAPGVVQLPADRTAAKVMLEQAWAAVATDRVEIACGGGWTDDMLHGCALPVGM